MIYVSAFHIIVYFSWKVQLLISMCQQFQVDNIVCPSQLRKQLFTCGALDNGYLILHQQLLCRHFMVLPLA